IPLTCETAMLREQTAGNERFSETLGIRTSCNLQNCSSVGAEARDVCAPSPGRNRGPRRARFSRAGCVRPGYASNKILSPVGAAHSCLFRSVMAMLRQLYCGLKTHDDPVD